MGKKHMETKPFLAPLGFHCVTTNLHNTGKLFKTCMILVCKVDNEGKATSESLIKFQITHRKQ